MADPISKVLPHSFQSAKADGADPTFVQPSHWNAGHPLVGGADGHLLGWAGESAEKAGLLTYHPIGLTNRTGGTLADGDVVALDTGNDASAALADVQGSMRRFVVAKIGTGTIASLAVGRFAASGRVDGVKATGAIARMEYVRKSATTKTVEGTGITHPTPPPEGALGYALSAAAAGVVSVELFMSTMRSLLPPGLLAPYGGSSAPAGWLLCDGSAVSRTTYADLFAAIGTGYGAGDGSTTFNLPEGRGRGVVGAGSGLHVLTISSVASSVLTVAPSSDLSTGVPVTYHTTGSVITGLTNDTVYYLVRQSATTFKLATTQANAVAGTTITLTGSGSGTQTLTYNLTARSLGVIGGEEAHALVAGEIPSHVHSVTGSIVVGTAGSAAASGANLGLQGGTQATGGSADHTNMAPYFVGTWIVKT